MSDSPNRPRITPVVAIRGSTRTLLSFRVENRYGDPRIEMKWAVGEPFGYAPVETSEEIFPSKPELVARLLELASLISWAIAG